MENAENSSNQEEQKQEMMRSILGERLEQRYVKVLLPTNGAFYEKEVEIRPYTFEDERQALDLKVKSSDFMNVLFDRCIKGINIKDLVPIDRNYLIFKIKQITSGLDVVMDTECDSCGENHKVNIDLSELTTVVLPEDFKLPIKLTLPEIEKEAEVTPMKVSDEKLTSSFDKLGKNIWRFVNSIHGVDDSSILREVIDKLPIQDVHEIIKAVTLSEYGISPTINLLCDSCGGESEKEIPIDANFLGMS